MRFGKWPRQGGSRGKCGRGWRGRLAAWGRCWRRWTGREEVEELRRKLYWAEQRELGLRAEMKRREREVEGRVEAAVIAEGWHRN